MCVGVLNDSINLYYKNLLDGNLAMFVVFVLKINSHGMQEIWLSLIFFQRNHASGANSRGFLCSSGPWRY